MVYCSRLETRHIRCLTWEPRVTGAQEAQRTDSIVHRDDDNPAPVGHLLPIVQRISENGQVVGRTQKKGSSEQVNHHWKVGGHWTDTPEVRAVVYGAAVLTASPTAAVIRL